MTERKLVVIKSSGLLPELNGIQGPVMVPTRVPVETLVKLVLNHRSVFECYPNNPNDVSKRIKLTMESVKKVNFGPRAGQDIKDGPDPVSKKEEEKTPEAPQEAPADEKKEEDPVAAEEAVAPTKRSNKKGGKKN